MATAVGYRYLAPSTVDRAAGGSQVHLATSGGEVPNPRFFDGLVANPRQAAQATLLVARVARTRFETGPTPADREAMLDPILTAGGGTLRVESFSGCCGVYSRLDLDPEVLDDAFVGTGTTNIDLNPPMRQALGQVTDRAPMRLEVGLDEVAISTGGERAVERKVPLPDRWVRGLSEVQVDLAGMVLVHDVGALGARRFLQSLPPRPSMDALFAVPAGDGLRLAARGGDGAVPVVGTHRLRIGADLGPLVKGLRAYTSPASGTASSSAWEIVLDGARLWLVLSPGVYRGFSGEGSNLVALALGLPGADAAAAGRTGFDLHPGRWFDRTLPFDRTAVEQANPRLRDARTLVTSGAVEPAGPGRYAVRTEDAVHRVSLDGPVATCTCPWFAKHQGDRGPCKHVLAAIVVDDRANIEVAAWPAGT